MKLITALIDDEQIAINNLSKMIDLYCPQLIVSGTATSFEEGIKLMNSQDFDVLFLDINIGENTGFDLINCLIDKPENIVLVTAYEEFALKSFDFGVTDYLLKPVSPRRLIQCVEKILKREQLTKIHSDNIKKDKILIYSKDGSIVLEIDKILYIESDRSYSNIFTKDNQKYTTSKNLRAHELIFESIQCHDFVRVHKSYLVNLKYISKIHFAENFLELNYSNEKIPINNSAKETLTNLF